MESSFDRQYTDQMIKLIAQTIVYKLPIENNNVSATLECVALMRDENVMNKLKTR